jgi:hypothetical protein
VFCPAAGAIGGVFRGLYLVHGWPVKGEFGWPVIVSGALFAFLGFMIPTFLARIEPASCPRCGGRAFLRTESTFYERLRDEQGYAGCPSIVRDAVRAYRQSQVEVFVPLLHPPGEGQVDFGRAEAVVAGVRHKAALFVLTLPHSNARFGCLFPRECTETFHEGHARARRTRRGCRTSSIPCGQC